MNFRALALVLCTSAACGKHDNPGAAGSGASTSAAGGEAAAMQQKVHPYIECLNRHSTHIFEVRDRYLDSVDAAKGPAAGQGASFGGMYDTADCRKGIEAAATKKPSVPALESAGSVYAKTLAALEPLMKEAEDYYRKESWKDDQSAKGIALHGKLVASWAQFETASDALTKQVEALNRAARTEDLAAREHAHGRKLDVIVDSMMFQAEEVLERTQVTLKDLPKLDVASLKGDLDKLGALVTEADTYAAAHTDEKSAVNRSFDIFMTNVKSFEEAALAELRHARDKTPFSTGERMNIDNGTAQVVNGTPQHTMEQYNHLVESYNGH